MQKGPAAFFHVCLAAIRFPGREAPGGGGGGLITLN